jgi:hypothetical protein
MVARWACYFASLENVTRSSLEIEWIKHANFWNKEHTNGKGANTGYLLQVMAVNPLVDEAPQLQDEADIQPFILVSIKLILLVSIINKATINKTSLYRIKVIVFMLLCYLIIIILCFIGSILLGYLIFVSNFKGDYLTFEFLKKGRLST